MAIKTKDQLNKWIMYLTAFFTFLKRVGYVVGGTWELSYGTSYTYLWEGNIVARWSSYMCIILLAILCIINVKRTIQNNDFIWSMLCVGSFVVWTIIEALNGNSNLVFQGSISTLMCLVPLFYLLGENDSISRWIGRVSKWLSIGLLILTIYSIVDFYTTIGYGMSILSMPAKDSLSLAVMCLWVYIFSESAHNRGEHYFKIALIVVTLVCSMAILSRSWVVQSLLLLMAYLLISNEKRRGNVRLVGIIVFVAVVLIIINYVFGDIVDSLLARVGSDTRSEQYDQFFNQVKWTSLILGNGMDATYVFSGTSYQYFDNQFLYASFHYGALYLISLVAFMMRTIFQPINNRYDASFYSCIGAKVVSWLYLLAMLGVSVYFKYDWSFPMALVLIFLGSKSKICDIDDSNLETPI